MCLRPKPRITRGKEFSTVLESLAFEHAANNFDAFPHHRSRADLFAFPFANLLHEDLRRSKPQQEPTSGDSLHHSTFHRDSHGMTCTPRHNSPNDLNAPRLSSNL